MREYTDEQLVHTYLVHKQESALEELVRRYAPLIYRFSRSYTGNEDTAADITQESFVKAWKHLSSFDQRQSFRTWMYTIAKRTAIDVLKKKQAVPFSALESAEDSFAQSLVDDASESLFDQLVNQETSRTLAGALAQLPPAQGSVIDLYVRGGLRFREIAEHLHRPLHTVKSQYRRGLATLKKLL